MSSESGAIREELSELLHFADDSKPVEFQLTIEHSVNTFAIEGVKITWCLCIYSVSDSRDISYSQ